MDPEQDEGFRLGGAVYRVIEKALWALAPILFVAVLLNLPSIRTAQQQAEATRDREVAAEDRLYCEKWGRAAGSAAFSGCVGDLIGIRTNAEQRLRGVFSTDF